MNPNYAPSLDYPHKALAASCLLPLLVLPWLNPFTSGPNSTVAPFLVAWFSASGAMLCWSVMPQTRFQRLQTVTAAWAIAACFSAVLGLLQYFDISSDLAPWVNQPGVGQAFGNLRQRNQFASLCNIGLGALWWWAQCAVSDPTRARFKTWQRGSAITLLALAVLLGAATAASGSRTGLLQLVGLLVLGAYWNRVRHQVPRARAPVRWMFAVALLAYVLSALALPRLAGVETSVWDRLSESSSQCTSRLNLWRNVIHLIVQKPLWGWGWGELDYAHFITLYEAPWAGLRFCEILDNAHNLPLHLAVELGLPVALLFCGAVLAWIKKHRPWQESRPERQLAWAVLVVIGVHSLLEYPLWYGQFQIAALLSVWILKAFPARHAADASSPDIAARWGAPAWFIGLVIAVACTAASRSYWRASQPYLAPAERTLEYHHAAWAQLRDTWLFSAQVDFAELAVTPVTPVNAARINALATEMLHFSPEPMVVQKLLQSAQMQGKTDMVEWYGARFEAAFPAAYAQWVGPGK